MKKILYTIPFVLLVLGCTKGLMPSQEVDNVPEDGQKVTLEFSIPVPAQTKADMSGKPDLSASKMYVLVFNTVTGALIEAPEATFTAVSDNGKVTTDEAGAVTITNKAAYKADVIMGSSSRALHFLMDAPTHPVTSGIADETNLGTAENPVLKGDTEAMVWQKLFTTGKQAAYWQRIELPNGIHAYTYLGGEPVYKDHVQGNWDDNGTPDILSDDFYYDTHNNKVFQGDYINKLGEKIVDGTGFFACDDVSNRVAVVPMVRNFARIKLTSTAEGLTLTKAVLANVPRSGYVAPYHSADNKFVVNYTTITNGTLNLNSSTVLNSGYDAPVPAGEIDRDCPEESSCTNAVNGTIELFTYERGIPSENPTCVLVCFNDSRNDSRWFKIDITDDNGNYVPLYRGFDYPMEIQSISGSNGYGDLETAFDNPSLSDVSGSPETKTLTRIADGKGLNLWVDYIDYPHLGDETAVLLRYKFWHDTEGNLSNTVKATVSHKTSAHAVISQSETLTGSEYAGTDTQDETSGWYYVSVPLSGKGNTIKRSVVRISGTYNHRTIYRDVTFTVSPPLKFDDLSATPLTRDAANIETELSITLPPSLGFSMFPMVLQIEALDNNLNPAASEGDMSAGYGDTFFSGVEGVTKNGKAIYFIKTVQPDDYNESGTTITVKLKTINASGNATKILVVDQKGRFEKKVCDLTVSGS